MTIRTPRALVVYESMFGNTAQVARAVAGGLELEGLEVEIAEVGDAPWGALPDVDLVVVGAPTHAFSLSRPSTRADAVRKGAAPERQAVGLREWLTATRLDEHRRAPLLAVFDTRVVKVRHLPKAAAPRAARLAERRGLRLISKPVSYLVEDIVGPLVSGELDRAAAWGRFLADGCQIHVIAEQARTTSGRE